MGQVTERGWQAGLYVAWDSNGARQPDADVLNMETQEGVGEGGLMGVELSLGSMTSRGRLAMREALAAVKEAVSCTGS